MGCVKPHPRSSFHHRWVLALFLLPSKGRFGQNWGLGTKPHAFPKQSSSLSGGCGTRWQPSRTSCTSTSISPCCKPQQPQHHKDLGSSCCLWPASQPCQGEPGLPRAVGVGLQAHAVPTEPSASIGSTTGGIRGFGRLITEFTFKVFV